MEERVKKLWEILTAFMNLRYFELTCLNYYMYSKFQRTEKYFPAS